MALPRPVVEPPPMATAQSALAALAASRARRAVSIGTCIAAPSNTPTARSPSSAAARSASARWPGVLSTSTRVAPSRATSSGRRASVPAPKTTRVAGAW